LYKKFGQHANALLLAIRLNDKELYTEIFSSVEDAYVVSAQWCGLALTASQITYVHIFYGTV
jgi:hypothetical protein